MKKINILWISALSLTLLGCEEANLSLASEFLSSETPSVIESSLDESLPQSSLSQEESLSESSLEESSEEISTIPDSSSAEESSISSAPIEEQAELTLSHTKANAFLSGDAKLKLSNEQKIDASIYKVDTSTALVYELDNISANIGYDVSNDPQDASTYLAGAMATADYVSGNTMSTSGKPTYDDTTTTPLSVAGYLKDANAYLDLSDKNTSDIIQEIATQADQEETVEPFLNQKTCFEDALPVEEINSVSDLSVLSEEDKQDIVNFLNNVKKTISTDESEATYTFTFDETDMDNMVPVVAEVLQAVADANDFDMSSVDFDSISAAGLVIFGHNFDELDTSSVYNFIISVYNMFDQRDLDGVVTLTCDEKGFKSIGLDMDLDMSTTSQDTYDRFGYSLNRDNTSRINLDIDLEVDFTYDNDATIPTLDDTSDYVIYVPIEDEEKEDPVTE